MERQKEELLPLLVQKNDIRKYLRDSGSKERLIQCKEGGYVFSLETSLSVGVLVVHVSNCVSVDGSSVAGFDTCCQCCWCSDVPGGGRVLPICFG